MVVLAPVDDRRSVMINCTIICGNDSWNLCVDLIESLALPDAKLVKLKSGVELVRGITHLRFSALRREKPGDSFSKLALSTFNFVEKIKTKNKVKKEEILRKISNVKMFIGIVGDPEILEAERHFDIIFALSERLDGLIFDGNAIIDKNGDLLLNRDGKTEGEVGI